MKHWQLYTVNDSNELGYGKGYMLTNSEILEIAMRQSALDINASVMDFVKEQNVIVKSEVGLLARKYYKEPIACNIVSYGSNIV